MRRKRIAFVISSLSPGGAERVVSNLANKLINDYHVTIIVLYNDKPFYTLDRRIEIISCQEKYNFNNSKSKSILFHFKFIKKIFSFIKQDKIDLCISFMTTTNIYATIASRLAKVPIIISERTNPHYGLNKPWQILRKRIYPLSNLLLVQTENVKAYYLSFMNSEKVKVIKNPLSPNLIKNRKQDNNKENIVLSVGRLSPEKNHDLLIKAFSKINPEDWKLILVGDGVCRPDYHKLITNLKMNNSIKIIGNIKDVDTYYNKAKIFVFTSRFEGFPNALIEAMAFGLPCISTDCQSGPSELLTHGENGFLIPVEDEQALQVHLKKLIADEKLRNLFGMQALKTAKEYEIDPISNKWSNFIDDLL